MNFVRIEGYPKYVIHPCGTVLRIWKNYTKEVKAHKSKGGYMQINLSKNGKQKTLFVHRLLALHFIENDDPENKIAVHHKDKVTDNNSLSNLEWLTRKETLRRMRLNNPRVKAEITKGHICKTKSGWQWQYLMKGKKKTKSMKSKEDLLKYKKDILNKFDIS